MTTHTETGRKTPLRRIGIRQLTSMLGPRITRQLPVIHAISGCDTTSSMYGHGKAGVFRTFVTCEDISHLTDVVGCYEAAREDIIQAGLQLMLLIRGGKAGDTLDHMRFTTYMSTVASSKLPP